MFISAMGTLTYNVDLLLWSKVRIVLSNIKVVIITNLGQRQNQHKMLKIQQIFLKLYRCLLYVVFHNLEQQNAGLVDIKRDLH